MITDHKYEGTGSPDYCIHSRNSRDDVPVCGLPRSAHSGESLLNDGPVRSTVERLQEEIVSLRSQLANYAEDRDALIDQRQSLTEQVTALKAQREVLMNSERDLAGKLRASELAREAAQLALAEELKANAELAKANETMTRRLKSVDEIADQVIMRIERLHRLLDS